jgi:PKD repeat protein
VTFTHTATAGTAAGVTKVAGDGQFGLPGSQLPEALVVEVRDAQNNPIPSRAVTWVIGTGGGSVDPQNSTTDAQGRASTRWTLGPAVGANTVNAVVSGVGTATFNASATADAPSASTSTVSASPGTITVGTGSSTITVTVRDASNNPVAGVTVSLASSGAGNTISPATAPTNGSGVATFTFSSTVAETKTLTATVGSVTITDQATVTVQRVASTVEITSDENDPSTVGEQITIEFTVTGSGGTPTGTVTVTISGGAETCSESLTDGSGSCTLTPLVPGTGTNNRRVITASYEGDARFAPDSDTENHRVDPVVVANNPPDAAFTPPTCTAGEACQFNDGSTDSDGTVVSWSWNFEDGGTSNQKDPQVTFATGGTRTVRLTVTDDDGATDFVEHDVFVNPPASSNNPPVAGDDAYTTTAGVGFHVPGEGRSSLLANDSDPDFDELSTTASTFTTSNGGDVIIGSDGSFDYTPAAGFTGSDAFEYTLADGWGATDTGAVTITVTP